MLRAVMLPVQVPLYYPICGDYTEFDPVSCSRPSNRLECVDKINETEAETAEMSKPLLDFVTEVSENNIANLQSNSMALWLTQLLDNMGIAFPVKNKAHLYTFNKATSNRALTKAVIMYPACNVCNALVTIKINFNYNANIFAPMF